MIFINYQGYTKYFKYEIIDQVFDMIKFYITIYLPILRTINCLTLFLQTCRLSSAGIIKKPRITCCAMRRNFIT